MWTLSDEITLFFNKIFPDLIFVKPAIDLNMVVLPIPDGPNKQIISPSFSILNETL